MGGVGRVVYLLHVPVFYIPPPYLAPYFLVPTDATGTLALADRVCAILMAVRLVTWGWFVTVPPTPQNAQAPIGLFMLGWTGAAGGYGACKLVTYRLRRIRDR